MLKYELVSQNDGRQIWYRQPVLLHCSNGACAGAGEFICSFLDIKLYFSLVAGMVCISSFFKEYFCKAEGKCKIPDPCWKNKGVFPGNKAQISGPQDPCDIPLSLLQDKIESA